MKRQIFPALVSLLLLGPFPERLAWAQPLATSTAEILPVAPSTRAVTDLRYASEWLARSYEVPVRVPQEMLLAGYSYSDALIALSLMHRGASLNELLELRRKMRWDQVAARVEIDPQTLPEVIRGLLPLGVTPYQPSLLHFLPDVYSGLDRDLAINAFPPTLPTSTQVERFRLSDEEVRNIRQALDDPFGVPEELLRETAGKGALLVGDWVIAGVLIHHRPLPLESVLGARGGQQLSWSEICLAYGMRPDVLTRGPLTGVYPVLTGSTPGTVLCARKRCKFPEDIPLRYELQRLTVDEKMALRPLMLRCFRASSAEDQQLKASNLSLVEEAIALQLSRMSQLKLQQIMDYRASGLSWSAIPTRLQLDLTGEDGLRSALEVYGR